MVRDDRVSCIQINDISNICNSNELLLFADDTNIFVKAKLKHEVYIEANRRLKQLSIYTMSSIYMTASYEEFRKSWKKW